MRKIIYLSMIVILLISCTDNTTNPGYSNFNGKWAINIANSNDTIIIKTLSNSLLFGSDTYIGNYTNSNFIGTFLNSTHKYYDTLNVSYINNGISGYIATVQLYSDSTYKPIILTFTGHLLSR